MLEYLDDCFHALQNVLISFHHLVKVQHQFFKCFVAPDVFFLHALHLPCCQGQGSLICFKLVDVFILHVKLQYLPQFYFQECFLHLLDLQQHLRVINWFHFSKWQTVKLATTHLLLHFDRSMSFC